ncbi:iron complex outermembrane recepter protein [Rubritalea squalenifaciens DSM 18772]|uniref:Iron complex outermembrane recepter protein n=1 Tax=Rubritalea squalenifaciens DSM 18772 TaxID=1123071 RepID=A0A1M6B017_9BACT|nr:TonB-dependent receptor [Rubritalea squalenifaciens]SHI42027.1 iron complex outermembrane recepter protein [Rubritalea squalenifaciens DSM 18772]
MKSFHYVLASVSALSLLHAEETQTLEASTLTAQSPDLLESIAKSEEQIASLPGGATITDSADWTGSIVKPEEIFQLDPGVYARSSGTANDTRLSVRGSGIQRRYGSRGISLLVDGMPANHADGSYYFRIFDPLSISYVESYRGANGLAYGGSQLGGAINVVQKNGLSHPGGQLLAEYGSYDSYRTAFQYGGSNEKWDWFAGYTYAESDGYRAHSSWASHQLNTSLGYHWSESALTRISLLFSDSDGLLTGSLTEDQYDDDPQQSSNAGTDLDRDLSTIRIGQRTAWETANGAWQFSTNYQYLDFDHLTTTKGLFFPKFDNLIDYDTDELSLNLRGRQSYSALGLKHTFRSNFDFIYGVNELGGSSAFGAAGIVDRKETSRNLNVYLENTSHLTEQHNLIYGLGYVDSYRKREIRSADSTGLTRFDDSQNGFTWRAGYLYELDEKNQYFANISQSFESAPFSELGNIANPQEAITYEIGTRLAPTNWLSGELTLYYSEVNEEFVYEETGPGTNVYNVTNADTTHQGIELAAHANLTEAFKLAGNTSYSFDLAYQLNDFTFDEGPAKGKDIPVVSKHVISSRITAGDSDGRWKAALSVDWLPDGLVADNNNTLSTPGYALWDLFGEYQVTENLSIYAGVDNLLDKKYVSTVTVNPDTSGTPAYINPGDGRTAYIGAKLVF